jgi:hypothetical protein
MGGNFCRRRRLANYGPKSAPDYEEWYIKRFVHKDHSESIANLSSLASSQPINSISNPRNFPEFSLNRLSNQNKNLDKIKQSNRTRLKSHFENFKNSKKSKILARGGSSTTRLKCKRKFDFNDKDNPKIEIESIKPIKSSLWPNSNINAMAENKINEDDLEKGKEDMSIKALPEVGSKSDKNPVADKPMDKPDDLDIINDIDDNGIYDFTYVYPYHDEPIKDVTSIEAINKWIDTTHSENEYFNFMDKIKLVSNVIISTWTGCEETIRAIYAVYLAKDIYEFTRTKLTFIEMNNLIYDCLGAEPDWNSFPTEMSSLNKLISYSNLFKLIISDGKNIVDEDIKEIRDINNQILNWILTLNG